MFFLFMLFVIRLWRFDVKKILTVCLKRLLPLVCMVYMLLGCELLQVVFEISDAVGEITDAITEPLRAKALAQERAMQFSKGGNIPFTNPAEDRLTRRTSTLAGVPFDVSPYLLHGNSFAVIENEVQHYRSVLEFTQVHDGYTVYGNNMASLFEFDVALTFEADGQSYQMDSTVAVSELSHSKAQNHVKKYMQQYAAERFELDPKNIKNFKVKFLKTRNGRLRFGFQFGNVFVHDIEPGYFQFDVEVEYQKRSQKILGFDTKVRPDNFAVFNRVYRSDFTSPEIAAIDVQGLIWRDACKSGFKQTPLPIINFVRSVKVKQ
ncbi:MAG: hypothetical protein LBB72_00900 [Spirochaetaceae bacterium]|nr:hypothetical protein [Spirochaetaceae bacterium]